MFYNKKEPLYTKTDTSHVGLGTGLLQVREGMKYPCDDVADNTELSIFSSMETMYSNIEV